MDHACDSFTASAFWFQIDQDVNTPDSSVPEGTSTSASPRGHRSSADRPRIEAKRPAASARFAQGNHEPHTDSRLINSRPCQFEGREALKSAADGGSDRGQKDPGRGPARRVPRCWSRTVLLLEVFLHRSTDRSQAGTMLEAEPAEDPAAAPEPMVAWLADSAPVRLHDALGARGVGRPDLPASEVVRVSIVNGRVAGGISAPGSHRTRYVDVHITGSARAGGL